jgi:predicted nuclease with TOPRIM domain
LLQECINNLRSYDQKRFRELQNQIKQLEAENLAINGERDRLEAKFKAINEENGNLKAEDLIINRNNTQLEAMVKALAEGNGKGSPVEFINTVDLLSEMKKLLGEQQRMLHHQNAIGAFNTSQILAFVHQKATENASLIRQSVVSPLELVLKQANDARDNLQALNCIHNLNDPEAYLPIVYEKVSKRINCNRR